jgi:hypothetical protein
VTPRRRLAAAPASLWAYVWSQVLALTCLTGQSFAMIDRRLALAVIGIAVVSAAGWALLAYFLLRGSRVAHVIAVITAVQWLAYVGALAGRPTAVLLYLLGGPVAMVLLCLPSARQYVWQQPSPAS